MESTTINNCDLTITGHGDSLASPAIANDDTIEWLICTARTTNVSLTNVACNYELVDANVIKNCTVKHAASRISKTLIRDTLMIYTFFCFKKQI